VHKNYQLVKEGPRKEDIEDARVGGSGPGSVKLNETQLSYTTLYSPISGVVLVKSGEIGEVVNPGHPLSPSLMSKMLAEGLHPETDLSKVKWGQDAIVTTDLRPQERGADQSFYLSSPAREFTPKQIQTEKER